MKKLLINILKGCYLHTLASPGLIKESLLKLTMGKNEFDFIEKESELIFNMPGEKESIIFTLSKTGYIIDINIK